MIPAIPYMTIIRQYALARGLKMWTWRNVLTVIELYEMDAAILN